MNRNNAQKVKVVVVCFLSGLCSGLFFGWLTQLPNLRDFWFLRGDKFLIPTYRYWIGVSASFLIALSFGYLLACSKSWLNCRRVTSFRLFSTVFIIAALAPSLAFLEETSGIINPIFWDFFIFPLISVSVIPLGLWLYTNRWNSFITVLMVLAVIFSITISYLVGILLKPANDFMIIFQISIEKGVVAALSGTWLSIANGDSLILDKEKSDK